MATIRVLSAEGEEILWPHAAAAEQAIALKDWIDDTGGGGVFKGTKDAGVSAPALRGLAAFSEQCGAAFASECDAARDAAASAWAAEGRSLAELAPLLHGVNFLEMPSARQVLSLQFCARLAGRAPTSSQRCWAQRVTSRTRSVRRRGWRLSLSLIHISSPRD